MSGAPPTVSGADALSPTFWRPSKLDIRPTLHRSVIDCSLYKFEWRFGCAPGRACELARARSASFHLEGASSCMSAHPWS